MTMAKLILKSDFTLFQIHRYVPCNQRPLFPIAGERGLCSNKVIALIPCRSTCQMLVNFLELNSKELDLS